MCQGWLWHLSPIIITKVSNERWHEIFSSILKTQWSELALSVGRQKCCASYMILTLNWVWNGSGENCSDNLVILYTQCILKQNTCAENPNAKFQNLLTFIYLYSWRIWEIPPIKTQNNNWSTGDFFIKLKQKSFPLLFVDHSLSIIWHSLDSPAHVN